MREGREIRRAEAVLDRFRTAGFVCPQFRDAFAHTFPTKPAVGLLSTEQRLWVYASDLGKCVTCARFVEIGECQVDHIERRTDGGLNVPHNVRTICVECHREKTSCENILQNRHKNELPEALKTFICAVIYPDPGAKVSCLELNELVNIFTPFCVSITESVPERLARFKNPARVVTTTVLDLSLLKMFPDAAIQPGARKTPASFLACVRFTQLGEHLQRYRTETHKQNAPYVLGTNAEVDKALDVCRVQVEERTARLDVHVVRPEDADRHPRDREDRPDVHADAVPIKRSKYFDAIARPPVPVHCNNARSNFNKASGGGVPARSSSIELDVPLSRFGIDEGDTLFVAALGGVKDAAERCRERVRVSVADPDNNTLSVSYCPYGSQRFTSSETRTCGAWAETIALLVFGVRAPPLPADEVWGVRNAQGILPLKSLRNDIITMV